MKVLFITPSLAFGGAQMMLYKVLSRIDRKVFSPEVISLTNTVPLEQKLTQIGIPVHILDMNSSSLNVSAFLRICSILRNSRPDLILTWMYHSDLIGGIAAMVSGSPPVVWNIRHSNLDHAVDKSTTVFIAKFCAFLSHWLPKRIICCAESAREMHVDIGYAAGKFIVIPNGFDSNTFRPCLEKRERIRKELLIKQDDLVIGLVARFHPQKDHHGFIMAASEYASQNPKARFILCGDGVSGENSQLRNWIKAFGMSDHFFLLGSRSDIPAINAAFDIACSSSACGEAFSNSLGEAMACGVPCIATRVGDAAEIIGDTGKIIPPRDPVALTSAMNELGALGEEGLQSLGEQARLRIIEHFSIDKVTSQYEKLFVSVVDEKRFKGKVPCPKS